MPDQQQELGGPGTALAERPERMPTRGMGAGMGLIRLIAPVEEIMEAQHETRGLLRAALKEGRDYGVIPGTGKDDDITKRTLFKPGAERINAAFGVVAHIKILESEIDHDREVPWEKQKWQWHPEIRGRKVYYVEASGVSKGLYRHVVMCELYKDGVLVGQGIGTCSTMETKYVDRPRDLENTVLKMAKKRAFIDATLTTFGLSDEFTQDLDDEDYVDGGVSPANGADQAAGRKAERQERTQGTVSKQTEQTRGKVAQAQDRLNDLKDQQKQRQAAPPAQQQKPAVAAPAPQHQSRRPPNEEDMARADEIYDHVKRIWDGESVPELHRMDDVRMALQSANVPRTENGVPNVDVLGPEEMQTILEYVRDKHAKKTAARAAKAEAPAPTPAAVAPVAGKTDPLTARKVGKVLHLLDPRVDKTCIGCSELLTSAKEAPLTTNMKDYCKSALQKVDREYTPDRVPDEILQAMAALAATTDLPF